VASLVALDPSRPIREADIDQTPKRPNLSRKVASRFF
jgi:hypothetical protein